MLSAINSSLLQPDPVVYLGTLNSQVVTSTSNLNDGAFTFSVGRIALTVIPRDRFGNQLSASEPEAVFQANSEPET